MNGRITYIYALCEPDTEEVRYIGKSDNPAERFKHHLMEKHRNHRCYWIQRLLGIGKQPILKIIEEVLFDTWEVKEREWIAKYRNVGANLVNGNDGGIGMHEPTEEIREKMRKAKVGYTPWNKGKTGVYTKDRIEGLRRARLGKPSPFKNKKGSWSGKKLPEQMCEAISRGRKLFFKTHAHNRIGYTYSQEEKDKLSRSLTKYVYVYKSPMGGAVSCRSPRILARQYDLVISVLYRIIGTDKKHKGWSFVSKTRYDAKAA